MACQKNVFIQKMSKKKDENWWENVQRVIISPYFKGIKVRDTVERECIWQYKEYLMED